jgi:hypothetical protein
MDAIPSQTHPDAARADALEVWLSCLKEVEVAMDALNAASRDDRLGQQTFESISSASADDKLVSFGALCLKFKKSRSRVHRLQIEAQRVASTLGGLLNQSFRAIPFHRLPNELLQCVFLFAVEQRRTLVEPVYENSRYQQNYKVRNVLRSVCKRWRSVCDQTSGLWTSMLLDEGSATSHRLQECIARAKGAPLRLTFDGEVYTVLDDVMGSLTPSLPQVHAIEFVGQTPAVITRVLLDLRSAQQESPNFFTLVMRTGEWRWGNGFEDGPTAELLGFFPQLQQLEVEGFSFDWSSSSLKGLTSLKLSHISTPSIEQLQATLTECNKLVEFQLSFCGQETDPVWPDPEDYESRTSLLAEVLPLQSAESL